ncbi:GntR family transcriptional regulator [Bradyrhizobium diazoefficiens]|uniref:GntR family transcriptional regulator n=1 Tax=Bradyrhizobium diazoefficiens TaxID=1355477 RepID=UPI00190C928F|nr:GntR family transcriptional regulator [Bradyrhizobium diazoefficiens]MBK3662795.1 GntR family transcriptional regulator [Bradyrhizobium diazoefficiens]
MINSQLRASSSLHQSVREEILKRITKGTYPPSVPIPSTAMLSEEFGVSPITIKRALRDLQALGVLTAVAGKGTFVKEQKRFLIDLSALVFSWENASIRLLSVTREKITDPTMRVLKPPSESMLCVRKIISFGDEIPAVYDSTYISSDVDGEIIDEFGERLVTEALSRNGIRIRSESHMIDAAPAAGQAAEVFAIPNGYPMLRRLYKFTTSKPGVTVFGVLQSPFDRLAYTLNLQSDRKNPAPKK